MSSVGASPGPHALVSLLLDLHLPPAVPMLTRLLEPCKRRSPPLTGYKLQRRRKQGSSSSSTRPWKPCRPRKLQGHWSRREQPWPWMGDRHRHGASPLTGFSVPTTLDRIPFFLALPRHPRPSSRHGCWACCFPDVRSPLS